MMRQGILPKEAEESVAQKVIARKAVIALL